MYDIYRVYAYTYTYTHTHTHIYIYIYIYPRRSEFYSLRRPDLSNWEERERVGKWGGENLVNRFLANPPIDALREKKIHVGDSELGAKM
jgi:hypothetical protein